MKYALFPAVLEGMEVKQEMSSMLFNITDQKMKPNLGLTF